MTNSAMPAKRTRRTFVPKSPGTCERKLPLLPPRIAPRRSLIVELSIHGLLVARGAHPLARRQANQLAFRVWTVDRAGRFRRAVDAPPVVRLPDSPPDRGEVQHHPVEEGARRRDQRDEENALENDFGHRIQYDEWMTAVVSPGHAATVRTTRNYSRDNELARP